MLVAEPAVLDLFGDNECQSKKEMQDEHYGRFMGHAVRHGRNLGPMLLDEGCLGVFSLRSASSAEMF
jgi:hypothetical protein